MGFFDLAIAAPSMKAALEAWGSNMNLFHQGFAKEAADPRVIAATMKQPGVVLRRPVGTDKPFQEHADLPTDLPATASRRKPEKTRKAAPAKKKASSKIDDATARKAALAFEKEQRERESRQRKQDAADAKERERRQQKVAEAEEALEKATKEHDARVGAIEAERAKLDQRGDQEETRWEKVKKGLQAAVQRARG
jgi:colicin import membrane protein